MINKKLLIGVLVLAAAAIAVAVATAVPIKNKEVADNAPGGNTSQNANGSSNSSAGGSKEVDVKQLLSFDPGANATPEKLRDFSTKVAGASQSAPVLDITNCSPSPSVYRIKFGESFVVRNRDAAAHKLMSDKTTILEAGANSEKEVKANFDKGAGIYGYSCDKGGTIGIFFVTQ